jgi:hypothetical protein
VGLDLKISMLNWEETFKINVSQMSMRVTRSDGLMIGPWPFALVPSYSWYVRGEGGIRNHLFWGRDDRSETWQGESCIHLLCRSGADDR